MDAPSRPGLLIGSPSLSVTLSATCPAIEQIRLGVDGDGFSTPPAMPSLLLYDASADALLCPGTPGVTVRASVAEVTPDRAVYALVVERGGEAFLSVGISFSICGEDLLVGFSGVRERAPLELVWVEMRSLVEVTAARRGSRLVIPTNGGRLVDPARCASGERGHRYSWVEDSFCQVGAVYDGAALALLSLGSLDDQMCSYVDSGSLPPRAGLGVRLRHRYTRAEPSYRGRDGSRRDLPEGQADADRAEPSFVANEHSGVTLSIRPQEYPEPHRGWIQAARLLRERLPPKPTSLYRDRFVNKLFIGSPSDMETRGFDETLDLIARIHRRTGGARQIVYLVGFQHEGHDTGYPDVFTVNAKAGGYDSLLRLIRDAGKQEALVSFHDNYDDSYRTSPAWDPEDIGIDSTGSLLRGGVWNGQQAYWISLPVYARGRSASRIERTLARYPIKDTYHLDVLTASVFRVDFRRGKPRDRDDDLAARLAVIGQFARRGVDVSSEACGLPFLGTISYFWHFPRVPREVYPGDRRVPFAAFIAHGRADYGENVRELRGILDSILYGSFYANDLRQTTTMKEILDAYFLLHVPLNELRDEAMVDYEEDGTRKRVTYESGSFAEVDFESQQFRVVVRGFAVVEDGVTIAPGRAPGELLVYRAAAEELWPCTRSIPDAWRGRTSVSAVPILDDGEGEARDVPIVDGRLLVDLEPGIAYRCS